MCIITDGSELSIPDNAVLISDNKISQVYRYGGWLYKRSTPFLIENELWMLEKLFDFGFVPYAERWDKYTLQIRDVGTSMNVQDVHEFTRYCHDALGRMYIEGIRHGDLTRPHIIVLHDRPYIIDWAESRLADDPRPDKRPEGDVYWMKKTMQEIIDASGAA